MSVMKRLQKLVYELYEYLKQKKKKTKKACLLVGIPFPIKTSSPMGNDRSPWSQHNVWRHHNLRCSKADISELETVTRN